MLVLGFVCLLLLSLSFSFFIYLFYFVLIGFISMGLKAHCPRVGPNLIFKGHPSLTQGPNCKSGPAHLQATKLVHKCKPNSARPCTSCWPVAPVGPSCISAPSLCSPHGCMPRTPTTAGPRRTASSPATLGPPQTRHSTTGQAKHTCMAEQTSFPSSSLLFAFSTFTSCSSCYSWESTSAITHMH